MRAAEPSLAARPPVALYIHVPFCVSICPYCDFVVYAGRAARGRDDQVDRFVRALANELELRADDLDASLGSPGSPSTRPPLRSVYFGGGTPSLLPARVVGRLLERVQARFGLAADAEITLEANPGRDEVGDLAGFKAAGVNRLSLGAQSMDEGELRRLGRRHCPQDVVAAVRLARRAGFSNVSVDLLYDIPGQTPARWQRTLDVVVELGVEHVSAYALTLDDLDAEGVTGISGDHLPLRSGARRWRERARLEQDEDQAADLYRIADDRLTAAAVRWYEISNWAVPGRESRHNLAYWGRLSYEALGPGAHAFDGDATRRWNAARLDAYLAALLPSDGSPPRSPPGGSESLAPDDVAGEAMILALRTRDGIPAGATADVGVASALHWAEENRLLEARSRGRLVLSLRGRLLSNELFARLV